MTSTRRPARKLHYLVFALVFAAVFGVAAVHALRQPRLYQSSVVVQIMEGRDLNEVLALIESTEIADRVAKRLSDEERALFLSPYAGRLEIEQVLLANRTVGPIRHSRLIAINYRHADRDMAARVAWLFLDDVMASDARKKIDEGMREVEQLMPLVESQKLKVAEATQALDAYRVARADMSSDLLANDANYQALAARLKSEQEELDSLTMKIRSKGFQVGPTLQHIRVLEKPVAPAEDDYLRGPIVRSLVWGFVAALIGGLLSVLVLGVFTSRGRGPVAA